jgi:predicted lipoprotein with Yx(FWY)xxD motif
MVNQDLRAAVEEETAADRQNPSPKETNRMPRLRTLTISLAATTAMSSALAMGVVTSTASASAGQRSPGAAAASHGVTVKTAHSSLGTHLVDSKGITLYLFQKDKHSSKSHCYGNCAKDWPPLLTNGAPKAAGKAKGRLLGTTQRRNGDMQVTYKGHPLYHFSGDRKAGQTHGEGLTAFGAEWDVVSPAGHKS